jgi:predicted ATP-dependent Lon-type protease
MGGNGRTRGRNGRDGQRTTLLGKQRIRVRVNYRVGPISAFDAGAKRLLLPMASVKDIPTIPGELFAKFQTGFFADPVDAVFKALGVQ